MKRTVKKADVRRKEIIEMSQKLFLQGDYESTTMNQIIQELKIAKGTVYHYFSSKDDLLDAVVDDFVDRYIDSVQIQMKEAPKNAVKKLALLVKKSRMADSDETLQSLHRPGNCLLHTLILARVVVKLSRIYALVIQEGCEQGVFKTEHPLESAELLLAGLQFITDTGVYPWDKKDLERRSKAFSSLIAAQLGAPMDSLKEIEQ